MTDGLITPVILQAFSQQTTGSGGGYNSPPAPATSYFPSSTPSPSYAAPAATFAPAPSYSAPAPAPAPSYSPAPAPSPSYAPAPAPAQDEYGSPQAPVQDEYGSPQAPVSNGYAPPQPSYAAAAGVLKTLKNTLKVSFRATTSWVQSVRGRSDT